MPARNGTWNGSNWIWKPTRFAIYMRDAWACAYCRLTYTEQGLTLDHVVAHENGGSDSPDNLVTCCKTCNSAKADRTMREWLAYLRTKGIDTDGMAARVRRATTKTLNRDEAKAYLAAKKAAKAA